MAWDETIDLLREGYPFIAKRCETKKVDAFETRLMLRKMICMRGPEAARLITDTSRFVRFKAAPRRLIATLLGFGGVQGLDGEAHRHRKAMFVDLMAPERIDALAAMFRERFLAQAQTWDGRVTLFDALQPIVCDAVCTWAGVPLKPGEAPYRARQMAALIESGGRIGARHWQGRIARRRAERWAMGLVRATRRGTLTPDAASALYAIAHHKNEHGMLLRTRVAAVELLNVIRPTVAVARYMVFAALALHLNPQWRTRIEDGEDPEHFVAEVRRVTPFFPFVPARVKHTFTWHGLTFPRGRRVLLDLYGTNQDPTTWGDPATFRPERFAERSPTPFDLIPQGPGEHRAHHRCPGEWLTIALMKTFVEAVTRDVRYSVPEQNLSVDLRRMPTLPRSGFVIADVMMRGDWSTPDVSTPHAAPEDDRSSASAIHRP